MNEESQVRGCYNITFYLHQPGNSVGSPLNQMHRQQLELLLTTCYCKDTGGKRTRRARRTSFNTLDNWGHKTPTQSNKNKGQERKVKGPWPETCLQYTRLHTHTYIYDLLQLYTPTRQL